MLRPYFSLPQSLHDRQPVRHPARENVGVQQHDHADDRTQRDRMPEHPPEDRPFITYLIRRRRRHGEDCASTILPITPPAELAAHIRTGSSPSCCDVIRCRLPNSALDEVSLPVSATPSHPRNVPKKGNSHPVRVNANPSTASRPE